MNWWCMIFFTMLSSSRIIQPIHSLGLVRSLAMRIKKTKETGSGLRSISPMYTPKTPNQELYVKYLTDPDNKIVLSVGAAGSGKTLFACCAAVQQLKRGEIQKIIMTRPVVPVEEDIGFLPGSLIHKMDPWTRPIFDILLEFYSQKDIDSMLHSGVIEISPLAFMRGRTFKKAFIIADEMQNSSPNQMVMLTTRIGEDSKMVITGDLKQSDRGVDNGLADLLRKLKNYGVGTLGASRNNDFGIQYVELAAQDIQRSPIVARILDIYEGGNGRFFDSKNNTDSGVVDENKLKQEVKEYVYKETQKKIKNAIEKLSIDYSEKPFGSTVDAAVANNTISNNGTTSGISNSSGGGNVKKYGSTLITDDAAMIPMSQIPKNDNTVKSRNI